MTIHQEVTFKCSPERIFKALTTSSEFAEVTGAPAEIDATEGGEFSCFGGQIVGRNVELKEDQTIVQEWRVAGWPDGVHSSVSFTLDQGDGDTTVTLDQSGYPEDAAEHLEGGWHKMYWDPLRAYCE